MNSDARLLPGAAPPDAPTGGRLRAWLTQRFELSRHGSAANVRPMEGLRGFAVFLVFLVHYVSTLQPWVRPGSALHAVAEALHDVGVTGVDLFFVLSGFLIYGSLMGRPQPFLSFMARRCQRIYPAFLVVFAVYVALSFVLADQSRIPAAPGAAVAYLGANLLLLPGLLPITPLITVAWSLSYEMFYYLALPLFVAALGLRGWTALRRVALFCALALALLLFGAWRGGPVQLAMFLAGMLLHEALARPVWPAPGAPLALAATAAAFAAMAAPVPGPAGYAARVAGLFVAFFLLCHECFSRPGSRLARAFSWTPLRWLGNMSYSYYLMHGLMLKAAFLVVARVAGGAVPGEWAFWALLAPMFAATLVPSVLLFLWVERPFSLAPGLRGQARRGAAVRG